MNKTKIIYKIISVLLLAAVVVTIFFLSNESSTQSNETSGFLLSFLSRYFNMELTSAVIRTFAHFCEFSVLGFLTLNCIYAFSEKKKYVLSVLLSWGYAFTDEIHQLFVPGRAFQLVDLLVDLGGSVLGCGFIYIILSLYEKRSS